MNHRKTNRATQTKTLKFSDIFWREISEGQWEALIFVGDVTGKGGNDFTKVQFNNEQREQMKFDGVMELEIQKV